MRRSFEVLTWQKSFDKGSAGKAPFTAREESAFSGSIVRRRFATGESFGSTDTFVRFDERNTAIDATYERMRRHTMPIAPSVFDVSGWIAAGPNGLLIDQANGHCLLGEELGWSQSFAQWYTEQVFGAEWDPTGSSFTADIPAPGGSLSGTFASAPGQDVYGHWLLDYVPRFHAMRRHDVSLAAVNAWPTPAWTRVFTEACGVTMKHLPPGPHGQTWRLDGCRIPGFLKLGYTIQRTLCREAWEALARTILETAERIPPFSARKLFVTRSRLGTDARSLVNAREIETIARNRGYAVVAPEACSIQEQAQMFRDADIIVGQDGSALHNVVFCRTGAYLGVINLPERCNLWHASICDALGHRIAYAEATRQPNGAHMLQPGAFKQLLSGLEVAFRETR